MRRRPRSDEPDPRAAVAAPGRRDVPHGAAAVLGVQRAAGNRAVSATLSPDEEAPAWATAAARATRAAGATIAAGGEVGDATAIGRAVAAGYKALLRGEGDGPPNAGARDALSHKVATIEQRLHELGPHDARFHDALELLRQGLFEKALETLVGPEGPPDPAGTPLDVFGER